MTPENKSFLIKQVLRYLVERHPAAFTSASVASMLAARQYVDFPVTNQDVDSALDYLVSAGMAERIQAELDVVDYFKASAKGFTHHGRGA